MNRSVVSLALAFLSAAAAPALAGPASDAVKFFYVDVPDIGDPALRDRFTDPAAAILDKDAKLKGTGEEIGCIDFAVAVDAQDYDQASIDSTLRLDEQLSGSEATVTARFKAFDEPGDPQTVVWSLREIGGAWKVSDIASPEGEWRLSEFGCEAE